MAEAKEQQLRREWNETQIGLSPDETVTSRTLDNIATMRAGWYRTRGKVLDPQDGEMGFAYFPNASSTKENEWEQRSIAMHKSQETILPEPKPLENELIKRTEFHRGD